MKTLHWLIIGVLGGIGFYALQQSEKKKGAPSAGKAPPSGWTPAQIKATNEEAAAHVAYWKKTQSNNIASIENFPIIVDGKIVGRRVTVTFKNGDSSEAGFPYGAS
tara:strand:+ start:571 stop:888 length:318 start_codon:yes stop_codon:yes gene_type:complete